MPKRFIHLPVLPPSNNRLRIIARGRLISSPELRAFQEETALHLRAVDGEPLEGTLAVFVDLYMPNRRGDFHNRLKALFDACEGVLYKNDKSIEQVIERGVWLPRIKEGGVRLLVASVPDVKCPQCNKAYQYMKAEAVGFKLTQDTQVNFYYACDRGHEWSAKDE